MGITATDRLLPAWLTRVETGQIKLPPVPTLGGVGARQRCHAV